MSCSIVKKAAASFINCLVVFAASAPVYWINEAAWKPAVLALFFAYNVIFRAGCLGMRVVGTSLAQPAGLLYATLYTLSFATLLYHVAFWPDLALLNGLAIQLPCLLLTGNTAHGCATSTCTLEKSYEPG
jgi:hypothetical protein